jgi:SH3 domain protein
MRSGPLCLLLVVLSMGANAHAEESSTSLSLSAGTQIMDLQQRLKDSELQREELSKQLHNADNERESPQLIRLRQENQRLKLQLKEAQAVAPQRILTDQQQWFVAGGGVALVALLCGIFASGWRRQRRQWLN